MGQEELNQVKDVFRTNWVAPIGPHINAFEKSICDFTGAKHAAALSSGTAALHLALIQLGVGPGDEVIASSFTFAATINPIIYQGASPVLVESESKTGNMSPQFLEEAIRNGLKRGKKPKAIILVHLYGMPAQINEIMEICTRYEIPVIEDSAEALGSKYHGKPLGTFGEFGIFSFNGNKIITTSGGGCLISDNKEAIDFSKMLASQARDDAPYYQHSNVGFNYRMSNVCAAIGIGQMSVLANRIEKRRENYKFYKSQLAEIEAVKFIEEPDNHYYSNHWLSWFVVDPDKSQGVTVDQIIAALQTRNIESRYLWKPMHLQPIFQECLYFGDGYSQTLFENGVCVPSGSSLSTDQLDEIAAIVKKCFK